MQDIAAQVCCPPKPAGPRAVAWRGPIIRAIVCSPRSVVPAVARDVLESIPALCVDYVAASDATGEIDDEYDAAIVFDAADRPAPPAAGAGADVETMLRPLAKCHVGVLVLTDRPRFWEDGREALLCLPLSASRDRIEGALGALGAMRPILTRVARQQGHIRRLSQSVQSYFDEVNQELRLASRLQQDFLPKAFPSLGRVRFQTLYRPANWVSGDIFDIFRLDETHVGFYLADAAGHGLSAGLLTMYIRQSIEAKQVRPSGYELVRPADVLGRLNARLCQQQLRDSQFVTAWYGVVNVETLRLDYAVAGHPPPLLVSVAGDLREPGGEGCLLGFTESAGIVDQSLALAPGDRLLLYSDGLEEVLIAGRRQPPQTSQLVAGVAEMLRAPAEELVRALGEQLDTSPGGLSRADDASVIVMDAG